MAGVVYGAPYAPPMPPVSPWVSTPLKWTGWDGSEWNMCNGGEGIVLLAGARGFGQPPMTHWRSQSPAVAGARWRGAVSEPREVFWPLKLWHDGGSREWVERDRAFWRTLDPQKTGVWSVELPDGSKRSLTLRVASDGDPSFDTLPTLTGWARYGITLTADDPFWAGETVTRSWQEQARRDFLPAAAGESYYVSSGSTLGSATLTNPGDVDAHVRWTVRGPFSSVSVGVGGALVTAPINVAEGSTLVIDTDPSIQAAFLDGVDVTAQLTSAEFGVLPPGEAVPLSLTMAGTGIITAEFTPRFLRAW